MAAGQKRGSIRSTYPVGAIETAFRDLEHTIGTANFHSKSSEYIGFEILCRMTLYNFCTVITMEIPIKRKEGNGSIRCGAWKCKWPDQPLYTAGQARQNLRLPAKILLKGKFLDLAHHVHDGAVPGLDNAYNPLSKLNWLGLSGDGVGDIPQLFNGF